MIEVPKLILKFRCFIEFTVKDGPFLGRIIIELYHDHVPVTVQNFLALCSGEKKHHYKNCSVYRIVPGKYLETGDVTKDNGRGGASIYGKHFAEEGHRLQHTKAGIRYFDKINLPLKTNFYRRFINGQGRETQ